MRSVHEVAAYSTMAMTLGLVVTRPRLTPSWRLSPAAAALVGLTVLALFGAVDVDHLGFAATELRGPFVAIASLMVMSEVADRAGVLAWWAARLETGVTTARQLYRRVFVLGVVTSSVLTNDAAILLLTPLVLGSVRRRAPDHPELYAPFAFAVFTSAGVAAVPVANPMNMVVAEHTGIGFATYAAHMVPIAIVVATVTYLVTARLFARALAAPLAPRVSTPAPMTAGQRQLQVLFVAVVAAYPVAAAAGVATWAVALAGAIACVALARLHRIATLATVRDGVSYETLVFLFAVLVMALALRDLGLVGRLATHYDGGGVWTIGVTSALGSAVLNNHPMALLNMLAIGDGADASVLAALVGGDLGPRLLPMGSLAGLMWLAQARRAGVDIGVGRFVAIGLATTVVPLALALALLTV